MRKQFNVLSTSAAGDKTHQPLCQGFSAGAFLRTGCLKTKVLICNNIQVCVWLNWSPKGRNHQINRQNEISAIALFKFSVLESSGSPFLGTSIDTPERETFG